MKPRKLRIPKNGKPLPGATQLKQLPAESRARIYDLFNKVALEDIPKEIDNDFGIKCSLSAVRSFKQWQFHQQRLENYNMMLEQFEEFFKRAQPNASRERVRDAGIAFFMAEATANNDRKGFVDVAHLSVAEESAKSKAALEDRKLNVSERRVVLLEKKAAAYDRAQAALTDAKKSKGGITKETMTRIEQELNLM